MLKYRQELSFEWSHYRISSTYSKVRVTLQNPIKHFGSERVKGIRILESGKFLPVESGILGFGIRNTAQGIRNPTKIGIRNPSSTYKGRNPVAGIWNLRRGI